MSEDFFKLIIQGILLHSQLEIYLLAIFLIKDMMQAVHSYFKRIIVDRYATHVITAFPYKYYNCYRPVL